jgi:hypothetical protein
MEQQYFFAGVVVLDAQAKMKLGNLFSTVL